MFRKGPEVEKGGDLVDVVRNKCGKQRDKETNGSIVI